MRRSAKKILLLLLSLVLCISSAPVLAEETSEEVAIQNPGFEEDTKGWGARDDFKVTLDATRAKSGKNSIKIDNNNNLNSWVAQVVPVSAGLVPGAMYELGAWISTDLANPGGKGVGFKIEQYKENGDYISGADPGDNTFNINTLGQWNYHSMFFQVHQDAADVKVYLRAYTPGIAWYDDITITLSGGPEPYLYYADHVFHYPDEEEGNAFVRLDPYYAVDSEEALSVTGRFTFYDTDGKTVLDKKENVKFSGSEMKYTYPVSIMDEKQVQYQLKTELLDKTGAVIREWNENMYVYDRPLWFQDGRWVYNGERFDPILAYHVSTDHVKSLGDTFNTFQMGYGYNLASMDEARESYLASLDAAGKKALVCLYTDMKPAGHPDNIENTKRIVEKYKDDPRVFAWAVMDEPLGAGVTDEIKKWIEDSYRTIRDIDPNHPVYLLDFNHHEETIKYCDVFVADVYARHESAASVSEIVEPLQKTFTRVPTYELAASYKQNGIFPPMKTARGSVYRGFAAGNSYGTGFYSISDAMGHDAGDEKASLETLDVWPEYVKLLSEEAPILFDYYAGYAGKDYTSFNKYRKGEFNKEHLWETWFTDEGEMYLLAHNRSTEEADFNIPLVSANGKIRVGSYKAEPIGLTATGEKSGEGSISFTLTGEEAALYKITPSEKVDLSLIDAPTFNDLDGDYAWAAEAVSELQSRGIVNSKGEGVFAPGEAITRGDFAGFLIRTLGFTSDAAENFADVPGEREYAKEIAAGKALGILNGVGDNMFNPEAAITRQDMMTICARGMKMVEKLAAADNAVLDAFHDKMNVADYALESVSAMIASGIIKGDDAGYLNPTGNTRRAEAAVIMERILNAEKVAQTPETKPEEPKVENEVVEFDAPTEAALKKYNRAAALLKGLGTPEIKVAESITNGEAEAAVAAAIGMGFDAFGENHRALTTAKAVEEFVKLLGYEVYTGRDGGFMGTAARIDLLKGIDASAEYLRGGEFALMLENALGIYLCDRVAFGEGANEEYAESTDTLLTRYRHLTLHKGVLEQNENTGLPKGKVAVGTALLEVGNTDAKNFIGQRVEAYTEGEDHTIVFIRAHKSVNVTRVDADKISSSETTLSNFVYEDEAGHTKSIAIDGAKLLYNGKYKTAPSNADILMPQMGTVAVIENGGANAAYVLVEAYENFIVDSIFEEDMQVFFKNRSKDADGDGKPDNFIFWDETDNAKRLTMEGGTWDALKEWNVVSLYESEDGTVVRAVISNKTVKGTVTETSTDIATIDGKAYKIAENCFGTPTLGREYTYLLDAAEKISGINTDSGVTNYAYFTKIERKTGIDGKVQMRIFTKEGEMKIMDVKDTVRFNGTPVSAASLLENAKLIKGKDSIGQLVVLEMAGEEIASLETAENGMNMSDADRLEKFTYDFDSEEDPGKIRFEGNGINIFGSLYFIPNDIVLFRVPEAFSAKASDYAVSSIGSFVHGDKYQNMLCYDIDENHYIAAMVQTVASTVNAGFGGTPGIVSKKGTGLNADGEVVQTVTVKYKDEKTLIFLADDFEIVLGSEAITSIAKGETAVKIDASGAKTLKETMSPSELNIGDIVIYSVKTGTTDIISGMRVLCRAGFAIPVEKSRQGTGEFYNYSEMTRAYGKVESVLERGVTLTPQTYKRLYTFYDAGNVLAPTYLVEDGEVKAITPQHIRVDDMVYVHKYNCYQVITVVYR